MSEDNLKDGIGEMGEAALAGMLWSVIDPDPNAAAVSGKLSFSADQPTFLIQGGNNYKARKILSYLSLEQKNTAGAGIEILVFVDTVNRLSAVTSHKNNQCKNINPFLTGSVLDFDFFINPTLDVAASNMTFIDRATFVPAINTTIEIDPPETWSIDGGPGSLMIWVIAGTTAPTFKHCINVIQQKGSY